LQFWQLLLLLLLLLHPLVLLPRVQQQVYQLPL
jgi:hypothetical protein